MITGEFLTAWEIYQEAIFQKELKEILEDVLEEEERNAKK